MDTPVIFVVAGVKCVMDLLTSPDMKQYDQKQLVDVGQKKVLAVVAKYKKSELPSLMNFGYMTPGNGTACQTIYSLIPICCHQSFKSSCIHRVNGDYIASRKLLIVLSLHCCNGGNMQVFSSVSQNWLTKL